MSSHADPDRQHSYHVEISAGLARRLRETRLARGLSTAALARAAGMGDVLEYGKCGGLISHTYYNVVKQPLTSDVYGVTPEAAPLLCPGIKNGRLAPWESSFHFYAVQ